MKTILGIGNALTDILAILPDDSFLEEYNIPKGSMQHVDKETGDKILERLKPLGVQYVAGGSAANTITCTATYSRATRPSTASNPYSSRARILQAGPWC